MIGILVLLLATVSARAEDSVPGRDTASVHSLVLPKPLEVPDSVPPAGTGERRGWTGVHDPDHALELSVKLELERDLAVLQKEVHGVSYGVLVSRQDPEQAFGLETPHDVVLWLSPDTFRIMTLATKDAPVMAAILRRHLALHEHKAPAALRESVREVRDRINDGYWAQVRDGFRNLGARELWMHGLFGLLLLTLEQVWTGRVLRRWNRIRQTLPQHHMDRSFPSAQVVGTFLLLSGMAIFDGKALDQRGSALVYWYLLLGLGSGLVATLRLPADQEAALPVPAPPEPVPIRVEPPPVAAPPQPVLSRKQARKKRTGEAPAEPSRPVPPPLVIPDLNPSPARLAERKRSLDV